MGKNDNGNNGRTELVFVVDRSGSMGGLESDTIGGFNSMLSKQRTIAGECRVTTLLFDHRIETLHNHLDIREVNDLTTGITGCAVALRCWMRLGWPLTA